MKIPPLASRDAPVMNAASSEARKAITWTELLRPSTSKAARRRSASSPTALPRSCAQTCLRPELTRSFPKAPPFQELLEALGHQRGDLRADTDVSSPSQYS
jgi:hypothetical protein